jgi:hypothetical protein
MYAGIKGGPRGGVRCEGKLKAKEGAKAQPLGDGDGDRRRCLSQDPLDARVLLLRCSLLRGRSIWTAFYGRCTPLVY